MLVSRGPTRSPNRRTRPIHSGRVLTGSTARLDGRKPGINLDGKSTGGWTLWRDGSPRRQVIASLRTRCSSFGFGHRIWIGTGGLITICPTGRPRIDRLHAMTWMSQGCARGSTPTSWPGGKVEAALGAAADPTTMLAFWLVGREDRSAEDSGEICVAELFGNAIGAAGSEFPTGIKAHDDLRLHDDMLVLRLDLDATGWHRYAAGWGEGGVRSSVDSETVFPSSQTITYPLAPRLDLFEFPDTDVRHLQDYPMVGKVGEALGCCRTG